MTISNTTARTYAIGSATAGQEIPFSFPIATSSEITVKTRVTATGVEATLTLTTDYSVTINGDSGGTVTLVSALAATSECWIIRNTTLTQSLDLTHGSAFSAESLEDAFDKNTKLTINADDRLDRALVAPDTDPTSLDMSLPCSVDRASQYLAFDSNGEPTVVASVAPTTATITTFWEDTLVSASLAATVTNLGGAAAVKTAINADGTIDPRDYGAVGDGVTDDATALQDAIDAGVAAGNVPVLIPAGTYVLGAHLDVPHGMAVYGVSAPGLSTASGTILYLTDTTETCIMHLSDEESHSIEIANLTLRGPGEASGSNIHGIYYSGSSSVYASHIHHLYIEDLSGDAIHFEGAFSLEIDHICTDDIADWAYNGDAGPATSFHDWQYIKATTGGLWIWAGTPTVSNMNMEDVPIGLKFGNSTTGQTCLPNIYNINLESITNGGTGIWFNQGRPEYMHGITMYAAAAATVDKGVYFDSSNYGAFVTHAYVNFTQKAGGTYTNTYYADNGAISSVPIYVYDSDGTVTGMNSYMIKDSVIMYGESGDATAGGILSIGGAITCTRGIIPTTSSHNYSGGTSAWKMTVVESGSSLFKVTNAGGSADAVFPSAVAGKIFVVENASGAAITFKVTGQAGSATTTGKYSIWTMSSTDAVKIYEEP